MARISAAKIICIYNKLIKSQSPHKAIHFRSQLFQLLDIFRFFDFLFGGSLTALILFSCNRNTVFFTNVSLAESVSLMWFKDRPRFLYLITLHLSEIANYFVIITERLYLIQRRSYIAVKLTRNEHDYCHGHIWLTSTKTWFLKWEKIVAGRVWLVTAIKIRHSVTWIKYLSYKLVGFLVGGRKKIALCDFGDKLYGKIKT